MTTQLKNNETYTVEVHVLSYNYSGWSGSAYGVTINVIDRSGVVIKSAQLLQLDSLTKKFFTTSYQYDLTISQDEKTDYVTSVDVEDNDENIACNTVARTFSFTVRQGSHFSGSEVNAFSAEERNTLTVVFTNVGPELTPAPTGYGIYTTPFLGVMLAAGVLLALTLLARRRRNRRVEERMEK